MAENPLTIKMLDDLLDSLDEEWICPAGFLHAVNTPCTHPLSPAVRRRLRKALGDELRRLSGWTGGGPDAC